MSERKRDSDEFETLVVDGVNVLTSKYPCADDDPDKWRWMLDGDRWIKLPKVYALRREQMSRHIIPAGQIAITKEMLALGEELAELDKIRYARERGGEAKRDTHKCPRIFDWIVEQLRKNPEATNQNLADRFPKDELKLYRDDSKFVDDGFGKMSRHGFNRYVTEARQGLGLARKPPSRAT